MNYLTSLSSPSLLKINSHDLLLCAIRTATLVIVVPKRKGSHLAAMIVSHVQKERFPTRKVRDVLDSIYRLHQV